MFIFKYINDVLFFMKQNILQAEKDIYELLCNDDLYEFYIDNVHYAHYIIYTDNFGINYRVFIHDGLLFHNIEFFIESFDYTNKLILLAYEEDLPMLILLEDNENDSDKYGIYTFREVGKETEAVAPENNTIDEININTESTDQIFNFDTVKLTYDATDNVYKDAVGNIYNIYNKDNSKINNIIRHYKLIQKNNTWYDSEQERINHSKLIHFNDNTSNTYCLINISQNPLAYDAEINPNNWTTEEREFYNNHGYYQKNSFYQDNGFLAHNKHRDESLYFSRYYSLEELKKKLINDALLASYSYANQINKDYAQDKEFIEAINNCVTNYNDNNYMYIRLAPSIDMRVSQYERVLKINRIYESYFDDDYVYHIAQHGEIPIFNDNLLYSESKYNYIKQNIESDKIRNLNNTKNEYKSKK